MKEAWWMPPEDQIDDFDMTDAFIVEAINSLQVSSENRLIIDQLPKDDEDFLDDPPVLDAAALHSLIEERAQT